MPIFYPQANSKLAIMWLAEGVSVETAVAPLPEGTPFVVSENFDLDPDFLDAYEFNEETGAVLNMDKAKAIRLDQFREARKPLLEALDVDYMRALEVEDSVAAAAIAVRKQELRDVTKLPLPDSLDELKAFLPSALNP
jgi:hypothetical protein